MINWGLLIDEAALQSVLPEQYAHFARPIRDALKVFLEGLSSPHQAAILKAQGALPPTASISQRLGVLAQSCPALQKLGQVLARDQRLVPELRQHLQELESLPPTVPLGLMRDILGREFGALHRLGIELLPPAVAEASVAVVIPFRERQGAPGRSPREGVFKMLKPGIELRLEEELALFEKVGSHLDERCEELGIPHLDYEESFQQVSEKLRHELRLDLEQRHLEQARRYYADEPRVQIPRLFEFCSPRVTAMQRVTGVKVTDNQLDLRRDKDKLADLVVEALVARPVFAENGDAMFHSDPHPGNLFFTTDRRLAILDWSLVGTLSESERAAIIQILVGALTLDTDQIVSMLMGLADGRRVDRPTLAGIVRQALTRMRLGQMPGMRWLIALLDDAVQKAGLRVGSDMMLLRKMLHTLEGVLADLGADRSQIDSVLLSRFLGHFAREWPQRWLALPNSRAFPTRLSNADLTKCMLSLPWTAARVWLDHSLARLGTPSFN